MRHRVDPRPALALTLVVAVAGTAAAQSSLTAAPAAGGARAGEAGPSSFARGAAVARSRVGIAAIAPSRVEIAAIAPSRVSIEALAGSDAAVRATLLSELGARETARGTVVSLPGDVLFDFDRWSIRADARPTLAKLAELIARSPGVPVVVEGHTDAKGSEAYNQRLSERRADSVADWLARQRGVDPARLGRRGLGESEPVAPNARADGSDDPAGRQRNRRVEVILGNAASVQGRPPP